MHLVSSTSLLLVLVAASAHAADLATNFTSISATECKFPFVYNKVHYYGCTTAGNPSGDVRPWCVLKESASRGKQDWRFCDQTSVGKVTSLSTGDNNQCVRTGWQMTPGTPNELVFGCTKREQEKEFSCVILGKQIKCTNLTPTFASQNGLMAVVAGLTGNGTAAGGKNVATIIGASIGGALLVALVAGLVIVRRRKSDGGSKNAQNGAGGGGPGGQWDYKHSGMDSPNDYNAMSGGGNPGLLDAAPQGKVYAVVSTYTPTLSDELEIQPGDKVSVLVEYDDGWCQGVNHTRGGLKGVFPKHCVDLAT